MTDIVHIFDTTLRDGEQSAGVSFSLEDKLELSLALQASGVDVVEAGFAAASPAEHAAVSAVAREVRGATVCSLARAVERDVDAAASALESAADPRIHVFINSSDMQMAHQLRKDRDAVIAQASAMVRRARSRVAQVEFSPMDATRADREFLVQLVEAAIDAGATVINLPDTVGCALPQQVADMFSFVRTRVPNIARCELSFHGQDDLGLATANTLAAIGAGARQVELTINGIGERAGNTPFEEVLMALRMHGPALGVSTGVRTEGIYELSKQVERRSGIAVARNKAVVGDNAFKHASGIHQDGVLKHRENFESIDPAWVGHPVGTQIVLGKLSGRAGFLAKARQLGFDLSGAVADRAFTGFQALADRKRVVEDEDVRAICSVV